MCLPAFVNKYNRATNENNNKTEVKTTKSDTFNLYVQFFKSLVDSGTAVSLCEIRDMINHEHEINIVNFEVKTFLTEHFQIQIQFCPSEWANESIFVFSSSIDLENVQKLRSLRALLNRATTHDHPRPVIILPPPPTTSHNFTPTTHDHPQPAII